MDHASDPAVQRLALLLAGVPASVRRLLAGEAGEPLDVLSRLGRDALVEGARRLMDADVPALLERLQGMGWRWVAPPDPDFPGGVEALADPPLGLFVRGQIPRRAGAAVVGSRRATPYGLQVARLLGSELAAAGVPVVSGMARGVDAAAHEGALEAQGPTVAVWGTGPDRIYPPEHGRLAEAIVAGGGALVTEFPPGTPPRRHHFPQRNRILAGLASAVVVVEAAARSGALNTARQALDEGREVWAVPGSILSELSLGPNALLRLGARPLVVPAELVRELGGEPAAEEEAAEPLPASPLLEAIPFERALPVDAIAAAAGREVGEVLAELLELELGGRVVRLPDGSYARR